MFAWISATQKAAFPARNKVWNIKFIMKYSETRVAFKIIDVLNKFSINGSILDHSKCQLRHELYFELFWIKWKAKTLKRIH